MTVQLVSSAALLRPGQHRIVHQRKVASFHRNLHKILYIFKESRIIFLIMIPDYQVFLSIQLSDQVIRIFDLHVMTDITKDINCIILSNHGIVILKEYSIHFFNRLKGPILHIYYGSVAKVHICCKKYHFYKI